MDISTVKAFFMWCTIINAGLLCLTGVAIVFLRDFAYRMNNKMFLISRETFNVGIFSFIALYKMFVMVFNLVPYIVLVIIENSL